MTRRGGRDRQPPDGVTREAIETAVKRAPFLARLADGPTTKRDLRDDLDVSRSTVYKAVRELEDGEMVAEADDGCRLTAFGRLVTDRYLSFADTVADLREARPLLSVLGSDAPVTTDLVAGAERVMAERHAPARPMKYVEALVADADRVVGFSPVVFPQYVDLYYEQIVENDLTADLVVEPPVAEYLRADHARRVGDAMATDRLTLSVTDDDLPFGLVVARGDRDGVSVAVYDEGGDLRGVLVNDTSAALDWGEETFRRYREDASEVAF